MKRLCTLACLTLAWLLATATPASAHCHRSVTYGPSSVIDDCGQAAFWSTLFFASFLATLYAGSFLSAFYFIYQASIKAPFIRLRDLWHRSTYGQPLFERSAKSSNVDEIADILERNFIGASPKLGFMATLARYSAALVYFSWPPIQRGLRWIWRRILGDTLDLIDWWRRRQ